MEAQAPVQHLVEAAVVQEEMQTGPLEDPAAISAGRRARTRPATATGGDGGGSSSNGFSGAFGGGGGGSGPGVSVSGGLGGFGGGGGGTSLSTLGPGATGGAFGGHGGGTIEFPPTSGGGGGGAALGAAIFIRAGSLTIIGSSFNGNSVTPGSGGGTNAQTGQGKAGAIFVNTGATASVDSATTFSGNTAINQGCEITDNNDVYGVINGYSSFTDTAAAISFLNQPGVLIVTGTLTPAIQVMVTDMCNNPIAGINVTLSLSSGPNGATLAPITVASGANGIAIFSGVSLTVAGSGYVLQASAPGAASITTNTFQAYTPATGCLMVPANLTAWWRAEGDATDATGAYNGTIGGDVSFAPGEVGQAFSFDGSSTPYVALPSAAFPFPELDAIQLRDLDRDVFAQ